MIELLTIYLAAALSAAIFLTISIYPMIISNLRAARVKDLALRDQVGHLIDHRYIILLQLFFNFFVFMPKYISLILFDHNKKEFAKYYSEGVIGI